MIFHPLKVNVREWSKMNKNIIKWGLCAIAGILAVMGLFFTWKCPIDCVYGVDSGVFFFKKQILWNAIGIAVCIGAAFVSWRRWLKLAPWGVLMWFALLIWAVGFSPVRHGTQRWADFGFVCVNVHLVFVLAWALFTAWLCSKKYVKPWMIFAFVGILLVLALVHVLGNANRVARLAAFFGESGSGFHKYAQDQMKAAYAAAQWFGDADRSLRYLPVAYAIAMPSAVALLFGKWFTLVAAALFAAFGVILLWLWFACGNPSKRMFILFWGGVMVATAMYSFYQSVGFVPVLGFSPALVGYGGALAVIFWGGLGILFSLLSDTSDDIKASRKTTIAVSGAGCSILILLLLGMLVQSGFGLKFYTPLVKTSHLGEFGISAKRGEIYAADGSVLARSVKRYDVRIDPKLARDYKIAFNEDSVSNICSRLNLTSGEALGTATEKNANFGTISHLF